MVINHIMFDRVFKKWYMEISKRAGTSEVEISNNIAEQLIKEFGGRKNESGAHINYTYYYFY